MQIYDIGIDENKKETTYHGSYDFPIQIYETVLEKNILGFVNWHWHEELQLCVVTRGEVDFYVGEGRFTLKKGQGIFINSEYLHMSTPSGKEGDSYICINFHPRLIGSFSGSVVENKYLAPYLSSPKLKYIILDEETGCKKSIVEDIFELDRLYRKKGAFYEFDIYLGLVKLWKTIISNVSIRSTDENKASNRDDLRLKEIFSYIHENYMNKISLEEIARVIHLTKSECCHLFKKKVNCTIFEYIQYYRINKSIELLRDTNMSISEISYEVGFCSASYYCEVFKKKTSRTPNEYRRLLE